MGKNQERVRFCLIVFCFIAAPDAAETGLERTRGEDPGRVAIHCGRGYHGRTRHAARRDGFKQEYGFQVRLLRGEISFRPDHCAPRCPAETVTLRAATRLSGKIRLSIEIITR